MDQTGPPPGARSSQTENCTLDLQKPNKTSKGTVHVAHFEHFETEDASQQHDRTSKLLRKIDLHLLPFLVIMYLLNFLDRSNLTQARQGTLEGDLGMKGTDFNLATSIFFVGYLLMQLPSNMLLTRVRPGLYLSIAMTLWGVVSTCNAAAHTFGQLVVVRFFLGFVEVSVAQASKTSLRWCRALSKAVRLLGAVLPGSHFPYEFVVYTSRADASNGLVLYRECLGQHVWRSTRCSDPGKFGRRHGLGWMAVALHYRESRLLSQVPSSSACCHYG